MNLLNSIKEKINNKKKQKDAGGKSESSVLHQTLNVIGIIVCILIIPILVVNITLFAKSITRPNTPADFMGYMPLVVGNNNMSPEIDKDDLVIVKSADNYENLEAGTIISFMLNGRLVSQRIVETRTLENQQIVYVTKADTLDGETMVTLEQIVGVYVTKFDNLGTFVLFMQTPAGIITFVVIPLTALFLAFYLIDRKRYKDALKKQNNNDVSTGTQEPEVQN